MKKLIITNEETGEVVTIFAKALNFAVKFEQEAPVPPESNCSKPVNTVAFKVDTDDKAFIKASQQFAGGNKVLAALTFENIIG